MERPGSFPTDFRVFVGRGFPARLGLLFLTFLGLGCAEVKPYERGRLAHPTMQPDYGKTDAERHIQAIHEGPEGGDQGMVSGCGCN